MGHAMLARQNVGIPNAERRTWVTGSAAGATRSRFESGPVPLITRDDAMKTICLQSEVDSSERTYLQVPDDTTINQVLRGIADALTPDHESYAQPSDASTDAATRLKHAVESCGWRIVDIPTYVLSDMDGTEHGPACGSWRVDIHNKREMTRLADYLEQI